MSTGRGVETAMAVGKAEALKPGWREYRACRGVDVMVFFPPSSGQDPSAPAKAICAGCPVRVACLDYAMTADERWGVWGGLTESERRRLRRKRRRAA